MMKVRVARNLGGIVIPENWEMTYHKKLWEHGKKKMVVEW